MTRGMRSGDPPSNGAPPRAPAARPRLLTPAQRLVCAPLGFLWLVVLAILAVPVLVYMTVLYYVVAAARALLPGRRRPNNDAPPGRPEERVA
jgi:hypothetical protein